MDWCSAWLLSWNARSRGKTVIRRFMQGVWRAEGEKIRIMSLEKLAEKIPVIRASGSNYEIGYTHGKEGRRQIELCLEHLRASVKDALGQEWSTCLKITAAFLDSVKKKAPRYLEEIQGIADGSELTFEDVFALNCRTELGQQFGRRMGVNLETAFRLAGGCSVIGINHTRTASGTTIYGQNWDAPPEQKDTLVFIAARQKDKPNIAWIGESGLICRMAGMNSAGIGMGGNTLFTDAPIDFEGLPLQFAYRYIMDQSSFPDAAAAAADSRVASSINFMICGSEGEMVNMEMEYRGYGLQGNSLGVEDIMRILSEHTVNYPTSICQHADDFSTLTSTICDLNRQEMFVAVGNPCGGYIKIRPFEE